MTDRLDEAKDLLEAMARERPAQSEPLVRLGSFLRLKEDYQGAIDAYNRAFERLGGEEPKNWLLFCGFRRRTSLNLSVKNQIQ